MGYKHQIEDIIATGSELFRKQGYHNVGINDILQSCNIPKGSFYNFFYSKEDFALQVMEAYAEESLEMIRTSLSDDNISPLQRLKALYADMIDINEQDGMDAGCLINNMSIEMGGVNEKLSRKADMIMSSLLDEIAKCVEKGQQLGEIVDQPAKDIAEYLHAGIFGAFSRMKVKKNREYLDKWHRMTFEFISS